MPAASVPSSPPITPHREATRSRRETHAMYEIGSSKAGQALHQRPQGQAVQLAAINEGDGSLSPALRAPGGVSRALIVT